MRARAARCCAVVGGAAMHRQRGARVARRPGRIIFAVETSNRLPGAGRRVQLQHRFQLQAHQPSYVEKTSGRVAPGQSSMKNADGRSRVAEQQGLGHRHAHAPAARTPQVSGHRVDDHCVYRQRDKAKERGTRKGSNVA
eukprot:187912-Chlamydomonas_euryale.AAC.2